MKAVPSVRPPTYDEAYRPPHDSPARNPERFPLPRQEELCAEHTGSPPFGRYPRAPRDRVAPVHGTARISRRPAALAVSAGDWRKVGNAHARSP